MRTFDLGLANRFALHRHYLVDESKGDDILEIVTDISGLHATSPTTPYLSLFARAMDFTRQALDEELYAEKNLGKIRWVRRTIYILPKDMIPIAFAATRSMTIPLSEQYSRFLGVTKEDYDETSREIARIISGRGMTTREIKKELGTNLNVSAIVNLMCDQGLLIRGAPRGGWRSNLHTYSRFDEYLPELDLDSVGETEARKCVVMQYIRAFGPVSENDIAWWTGFPKREIKQILDDLRGGLMRVGILDVRSDYIMLSGDYERLRSAKLPQEQDVALLPGLDPYLMGYKDRERYLDPEHRVFIFDRSGNATSTILADGKVVGIWDFDEPLVKVLLFQKLERHTLERTYLKARELGRFISGKEVEVKECESMTPLTKRTAGGAMSPLKGCK